MEWGENWWVVWSGMRTGGWGGVGVRNWWVGRHGVRPGARATCTCVNAIL